MTYSSQKSRIEFLLRKIRASAKEINEAAEKLEKLSEQPTMPSGPQEGEWIIEKDEHGVVRGRCPKCGMVQYAGYTNFCPNCGAKLKGGAG